MTDHGLIDGAAKVAGKNGKWLNGRFLLLDSNGRYWTPWNPLTSNADAFRLMVDNELMIMPQFDYVIVDWYGAADAVEEPFGTDKHAATRRAIVRAVVEKAKGN